MMKNIIFLIGTMLLLSGCDKEFLSVKSDKKLVIPASLIDFRALLDNSSIMNQGLNYLPHVASDDFFIQSSGIPSITSIYKRNAYLWKKDIFEGNPSTDWARAYQQIFYANNVLDGLVKLNNSSNEANEVKGSALFFRAFGYFNLSQEFCEAYRIGELNTAKGLPMRLSSDISVKVGRSNLEETYAQMVVDLQEAIRLLPTRVAFKTQPSRNAAKCLLSRIYLIMGKYSEALILSQDIIDNSSLVNFKNLKPANTYPMGMYNEEVLFHSSMAYSVTNNSTDYVDSLLILTYESGDLRKANFFIQKGDLFVFKGHYSGSSVLFNGLAVDEAYLIAIECMGRLNKLREAKLLMQIYLESRFENPNKVNLTHINDNNELLKNVLQERRKSLLFRGLRWSDVKRLNRNYNQDIVLERKINNERIYLLPNSLNYVFPISDEVIYLSGIDQNERE